MTRVRAEDLENTDQDIDTVLAKASMVVLPVVTGERDGEACWSRGRLTRVQGLSPQPTGGS